MSMLYRRSEDVIARDITGETVLVPVRKGMADLCQIHLLNDVGAHIWSMLDGNTPLDTIVQQLIDTFEVSPETAREDSRELLADLRSAGLAEPVAGGGES